MTSTAANNGQIKMAAQGYSDISGLLYIFIMADRQLGRTSATSFGLERWATYKESPTHKQHI